jgi:hypothetical protein
MDCCDCTPRIQVVIPPPPPCSFVEPCTISAAYLARARACLAMLDGEGECDLAHFSLCLDIGQVAHPGAWVAAIEVALEAPAHLSQIEQFRRTYAEALLHD